MQARMNEGGVETEKKGGARMETPINPEDVSSGVVGSGVGVADMSVKSDVGLTFERDLRAMIERCEGLLMTIVNEIVADLVFSYQPDCSRYASCYVDVHGRNHRFIRANLERISSLIRQRCEEQVESTTQFWRMGNNFELRVDFTSVNLEWLEAQCPAPPDFIHICYERLLETIAMQPDQSHYAVIFDSIDPSIDKDTLLTHLTHMTDHRFTFTWEVDTRNIMPRCSTVTLHVNAASTAIQS